MKTTTSIIGSLLILLALFHATTIKAEEVEDEREFDYGKNSEKGPSRWGYLKPEWATCKDGRMQSPIDLSLKGPVEIIPKSQALKTQYKPSNATLINRGHDIQVRWDGDAGSVQIKGVDYSLLQVHWHTPSEHTLNGWRYAMELHMVHQNKEEKIAVIAVLYRIGKPDPFLSKLKTNLTSLADHQEEREVNPGVLDPNDIDISGRSFYRYMGSLTTPPCTEGVIWTVKTKIRTVSKDQIKLLREAVHDYAMMNARPLQPLNGRDVHLYIPAKRDIDSNISYK